MNASDLINKTSEIVWKAAPFTRSSWKDAKAAAEALGEFDGIAPFEKAGEEIYELYAAELKTSPVNTILIFTSVQLASGMRHNKHFLSLEAARKFAVHLLTHIDTKAYVENFELSTSTANMKKLEYICVEQGRLKVTAL